MPAATAGPNRKDVHVTYETPQIVASYSTEELVEEERVCTGYTGSRPSAPAARSSRSPCGRRPAATARQKGEQMNSYETPQIVATYSTEELVEEAAVCTGYVITKTV